MIFLHHPLERVSLTLEVTEAHNEKIWQGFKQRGAIVRWVGWRGQLGSRELSKGAAGGWSSAVVGFDRLLRREK